MRTKRWRVTEEMPEPTRIKNGLKVGDLVPERWGVNQLKQWIRLGRVEEVVVDVTVEGARPTRERASGTIETTEGADLEERERETIEGEGEEQEAQLSDWTLKTPPGEYLSRYPDGKHVDLARRLVELEGSED